MSNDYLAMPMLRIRISPEAAAVLLDACTRAGTRETGGMLFGEHAAESEFRIVEATAHAVGLVASFVRVITDGFTRLEQFFRRTRHDYTRFNYLGEWHSHPLFALYPSSTDTETMQRLVEDPSTGALFVVLLIVKVENDTLHAGAWAFFPDARPQTCEITLDAAN
jgi:proteasome lid subunit RPN8/RPN11